MIRSHIQLPKWIMRNFQDEKTGRIPYLGLANLKIGQSGIMKLGVLEDYYSADGEKFLSQLIEKPLSTLRDKVLNFINGTANKVELPAEDEQLLRQYFYVSTSRSKSALNSLKTQNVISQFMPEQVNHDTLVQSAYALSDVSDNLVSEYIMGVYVNQTDTEFVVPRNCYYTLPQESAQCIVMPITPTIALGLFPPSFVEKHPLFNQYRIQIVNDISVAQIMNMRALLYEYAVNNEFIIGRQKKELERLIQYLHDNKQDFEKARQKFCHKGSCEE